MMYGAAGGRGRSCKYLVVITHNYFASALHKPEPRFVHDILGVTQRQQLLTDLRCQCRRGALRRVSLIIEPPPGAVVHFVDRVVDALVGSDVEAALDETVPRWLETEWPMPRPRYVGRDLSWDDWLALPARA